MDIGLAKSHCRESHDFMTCSVSHTLTSWVLISPLSPKPMAMGRTPNSDVSVVITTGRNLNLVAAKILSFTNE